MFTRLLCKKILAHFDSPDLVFLLGTRQTGKKNTLSHLLAQDSSYSKEETWYCDFKDKQYRQLFNTATIIYKSWGRIFASISFIGTFNIWHLTHLD